MSEKPTLPVTQLVRTAKYMAKALKTLEDAGTDNIISAIAFLKKNMPDNEDALDWLEGELDERKKHPKNQ